MRSNSLQSFFESFDCRKLTPKETKLFESPNIIEAGSQEVQALNKLLKDSLRKVEYDQKPQRSNSEELFPWKSLTKEDMVGSRFKRLHDQMRKSLEMTWSWFHLEAKKKNTWEEIIEKKFFLKTLFATIYVVQVSCTELVTRGANQFLNIINGCLAEAKYSKGKTKPSFPSLIYRIRVATGKTLAFVNIQRVLLNSLSTQNELGGLLELQVRLLLEETTSVSPLASIPIPVCPRF